VATAAESLAIERKWIEGLAKLEKDPTARLTAVYKRALNQLLEQEVAPLAKRLAKATGEDAEALTTRLMLLGSRAQSIKEAALKAVKDTDLEAKAAAELEPLAKKAYQHGAATGYGKLKGVGVGFSRINDAQARRFIARLQPGTAANEWVRKLAGDAGIKTVNVLTQGVVLGHGPDKLARSVAQSLGTEAKRVSTFIRTETISAARAGNIDAYRANPDVVSAWVWNAAWDACMVCQGMNGLAYPVSQPMRSHPNCRCSADPYTGPPLDATTLNAGAGPWKPMNVRSADELSRGATPFNTGTRFARLPTADQRRILGPTRWHAWNDGQLDLRAIPRPTSHPVWGEGLRPATLAELGLTKGNYPASSVLDEAAAAAKALQTAQADVAAAASAKAAISSMMSETEMAALVKALKKADQDAPATPAPVVSDAEMTWTPDSAPSPKAVKAVDHPAAQPPKDAAPPLLEWEGELRLHRDLTGSTHGGKVLKDSADTRYAFKPALGDPWIVEAENAAAQLAARLGVPVPRSRMIDFQGQRGQLQEYLQGAQTWDQSVYRDLSSITQDQAEQLVRHHVFDWLIGNHDGHNGNFLFRDGQLWGIDKGQAWKFIQRDKLDMSWNAPGNFGTPVYKQLWQQYGEGRVALGADGLPVDLSLAHRPVIEKLARMSDAEFRVLVDPYLEALPLSPAERNKVASAMLRRKNSLEDQWLAFVRPYEDKRLALLAKLKKELANKPVYVSQDTAQEIDGYQLATRLPEHHDNWYDRIPRTARDYISSYTGSGYNNINPLAAKVARGEAAPSDAIKAIDRGLQRAPKAKQPWFTWRGWGGGPGTLEKVLDLDNGFFGTLNGIDDLEQLVGRTFDIGAYLSTSTRFSTAGSSGFSSMVPVGAAGHMRVVARVRNPKGARLANVKPISRHALEEEVLVARGLTYRIVGFTVAKGPRNRSDVIGTVKRQHKWLRRDDVLANEASFTDQNHLIIELEVVG